MLRTRASLSALACAIALACAVHAQTTVYWTGDGDGIRWSDELNWSTEQLPQSADFVRHETPDEIQLDLGSAGAPVVVASFTATAAGTLRILADRGLQVTTTFQATRAYDVVLEPGATPDSTLLRVVGGLSGGNVQAHTNGLADLGASTLWGMWEFSGGARAELDDMFIPGFDPLTVRLRDGSEFWVIRPLYDRPEGTFFNNMENELGYANGQNVFEIGVPGQYPYPVDALRLGVKTVLKDLDVDPGALTLEIRGRYVPYSDFTFPYVRDNWDSREVDIKVYPHPVHPLGDPQWYAEMISWNQYYLPGPFTGTALIFLDVPCWGTYRDLLLPTWNGPGPVTPTTMRDEHFSSIQETAEGHPAEAGLFRDIELGDNQWLDLQPVGGGGSGIGQMRLYYYGQLRMGANPIVSINRVPVGELGLTVGDVLVLATGTILGDWDGSCWITLSELRDLLTAIQSGSYVILYDSNCDGVLTLDVDYARASANYQSQPPCSTDSMGAGESAGDGAWDAQTDSLAADVAAGMLAYMTKDELAAYVAGLEIAAAKFAGTAVGDEMLALLSYLE